jgi:hypothetical protein
MRRGDIDRKEGLGIAWVHLPEFARAMQYRPQERLASKIE